MAKQIIPRIIFDLDGTIADTQGPISERESLFFLRHGIHISPRKITKRYSGVSSKEMIPDVFKRHGKPLGDLEMLREERRRLVSTISDKDIAPVPGTIEAVNSWYQLTGHLAIGSASGLEFIERVLNVLFIRERFGAIASSNEVAHGKPAPDVFLLAAERLDADPSICIVIEDGVAGMLAAKAAGMKCIALMRGEQRECPADIVVDDLRKVHHTDLFGLIAR
ncbi:HAD family phosphatase [Candidatus Kaiserbacteria bacterium]|nr:HAD family phosphatase [Candidatus Kaiserbacteria bacterium]